MKNYTLDTNIYRRLVEGKSLDEVKYRAMHMVNKGIAEDINFVPSITVLIELIRHLTCKDPNRKECFKALCLAINHHKAPTIESISYIPPLNVCLIDYFFSEDSKFRLMYEQVLDLAFKITDGYDENKICKYQKQIKIVKKQWMFERKEIQKNYKNYLKILGGREADWTFFQDNKRERGEFFRGIKEGKYLFLVAEGMMKRAFQLTNRKYSRDSENFVKLDNFIQQYAPLVQMNKVIMDQLGAGNSRLSDARYKHWNSVMDISIIAGFLSQNDLSVSVLVSEDKNLRNSLIDYGLDKQVMDLNNFKTLMQIA